MQDVCQSLCRLVVMAADNSSKLIVNLSLGNEIQRHLALSIIGMVLVSRTCWIFMLTHVISKHELFFQFKPLSLK